MTYKWTATAYSPLVCPTPNTCGAQSPRTRTVTCQSTTIDADTGAAFRATAPDAECIETKPAESDACPTPVEGDVCNDGDAKSWANLQRLKMDLVKQYDMCDRHTSRDMPTLGDN